MSQRKHSKQRDSILNFLMSRTDHPTADTVYMNLREEYPNISLGTVYRNLTLLTELGEIMKISAGDGADHYDANTSQHPHFICTHCQSISDIEMDNVDPIVQAASPHCDGRISTYQLNFFGVCNDCLEKESNMLHAQRAGFH